MTSRQKQRQDGKEKKKKKQTKSHSVSLSLSLSLFGNSYTYVHILYITQREIEQRPSYILFYALCAVRYSAILYILL